MQRKEAVKSQDLTGDVTDLGNIAARFVSKD